MTNLFKLLGLKKLALAKNMLAEVASWHSLIGLFERDIGSWKGSISLLVSPVSKVLCQILDGLQYI